MKYSIAFFVFVMVIAAALFTNGVLGLYNVYSTHQEVTPPTPTYKLAWVLSELGIPSSANYNDLQKNSRNPWDMAVYKGKLYIGGGDWDSNAGPVTVWRYNLAENLWENTGTINDEAVASFRIKDDKLIILGTDPKDEHDFGSYYVLNDDAWETVRKVPYGVHMFDIVRYKNETFYAIGNKTNAQSPVQKTDDGEKFVNVPFYKNGKKILGNKEHDFSRCYSLFVANDRLFAFCMWHNTGNYGFFEYDGSAFNLISENTSLEIMAPGINQQSLIDDWVTFNGKSYFSFGNLYSTEDFKKLVLYKAPDNAYVQDMIVQDGKMYLLTSSKYDITSTDGAAQKYKNTVWEYSETEGFKMIFSFDYGLNAMNFAIDNGIYYIGIGNYNEKTADKTLNGMILKIEQKLVEE